MHIPTVQYMVYVISDAHICINLEVDFFTVEYVHKMLMDMHRQAPPPPMREKS